ncbi:MAG: DsbA family protein [Bryobacteraceae bacterium]|nr:DsbA family protein [Bryobacteraceae bacterium]
MRHLAAGLLAFALLVSAQAAETGKKSALDKATLETFVRHLLLWGPEVKVEVSDPKKSDLPGLLEVTVRGSARGITQDENFYVSQDGQKVARALVFDIARNPFYREIEKLKLESQPSLGKSGAPVALVVFSDFQCQFCAHEGKMLREKLIQAFPQEVRLYFKDFPLDQIHPWARSAALAGRCAYRESEAAFWDYHDWVFQNQAQITAENFKSKFLEFAKSRKMDEFKLGNCLDAKATAADVDRSVLEAKELRISGTPTLFVNGRRIPNQIPWENLRQIIQSEIEYQKKTNGADEACCSVTLPTPLAQ